MASNFENGIKTEFTRKQSHVGVIKIRMEVEEKKMRIGVVKNMASTFEGGRIKQ